MTNSEANTLMEGKYKCPKCGHVVDLWHADPAYGYLCIECDTLTVHKNMEACK